MKSEIWRSYLPTPQGDPFTDLDDPSYRPGLWWLPEEPRVLDHWSPILRNNFDYLVQLVETAGDRQRTERAKEARVIFRAYLDDLPEEEARELSPTIHHITLFRESLIRAFELGDPYQSVKREETERALERLMAEPEQWGLAEAGIVGCEKENAHQIDPRRLLAGVMSGNLFDLGSALTQKAFREGSMDLKAALGTMSDQLSDLFPDEIRIIEDVGWRGWLLGTEPCADPAGRLLLFVDNAGADFILGVLPLAAALTREWETVFLAMNTTPASNDMTLPEGEEIMNELRHCTLLGSLSDEGRIRLVGTETGTPGIDLLHVGDELNRVSAGVDAIILEGQGRGVETTWGTRFSKPVTRLAVVKDPLVAQTIGRDVMTPLIKREFPKAI